MADDKPIIVIKKKGGHGGHHGGAWKVAYADFVTAMMAFFMVMWLLNSAESPTKQAIASYFRKPGLFQQGSGTPLQIGGAGIMDDSYAPPRNDESGDSRWQLRKRIPTLQEELKDEETTTRLKGLTDKKPEDVPDKNALMVREPPTKYGPDAQKIKQVNNEVPDGDHLTPWVNKAKMATEQNEKVAEEIEEQFKLSPELKALLGDLEVKADADGLTIEIMDTDKTSMFSRGSSKVNPQAAEAFNKLATIIAPLSNTIEIIGHTDAKPFSNIRAGFSNWELSAARANEARKLIEAEGYPQDRIISVVGKADRALKNTADPFASANRRITLKMKFEATKDVNVGKDPDAINKAQAEVDAAKEARLHPPTPAPVDTSDPSHSMSAKDVLESKPGDNKTISKEKEPAKKDPASTKDDEASKDKIFGQTPVFGPKDIFSDL